MSVSFEQLLARYPELQECKPEIERSFEILKNTFLNQGKLLVCGNGGSAADAEHIVGELMKGYISRRPLPLDTRLQFENILASDGAYLADRLQGALPAISLASQVSLSTAVANDIGAEMVFAQQVYGYGRQGDALLTISTSGNALNVIRAAQVARVMGMHILGLTGRNGGRLKELCDVAICVPWDDTPFIQERHLPIIHALCEKLETAFFA
jgi:D-sedoheptulose 7-phosphate isomerase